MMHNCIWIIVNGNKLQTRTPCSVEDFVERTGLKPTQVVVELNGKVVARQMTMDIMLNQGDRLEIIVPVAGG